MIDIVYKNKIKTADEINKIIGDRPRSKKVIMCHGNFDIVHPGHIRHLMFASSRADILIASLTCDIHITKGDNRPYVPEELRAINLSVLDMVDYVIIDSNKKPIKNIAIIKPDYFAKGADYRSDKMHPNTLEEKKLVESYGGEIIFTPGDIVFSSTSIINQKLPKLKYEKLIILLEAENIEFKALYDVLDDFNNKEVLVLGDTIVDSYTETEMIGGQTKTPTISVRYINKKDYVGGAGIVSKHLAAAGAKVNFSSVLGNDDLKEYVEKDIKLHNINFNYIIDDSRPTTNKNVITNGVYKLLKIDHIDNRAISDTILDSIINNISSFKGDAVIFSDFRHGIFNANSIPKLVETIPDNVFKVADSQVASRWGNILEFQGFDLITPNEREARFSLGDQDSVIRPLAKELYNKANCKNLLLKLGEKGVIVYRKSTASSSLRSFFALDSFAENVVDSVGAGDAMLAYSTLAFLSTKNILISAIIGLVAASLECEYDGNIPIKPEDIKKRLKDIEPYIYN
ncbi:MAG: adenylyltransferase/cytidyltransferase family protein [Pelagibacterales bacterium]|nr:adenylyltransferase/cytidyltransferase family protein [Pelagibacterales bacterium]